jgi:hypothetical protein
MKVFIRGSGKEARWRGVRQTGFFYAHHLRELTAESSEETIMNRTLMFIACAISLCFAAACAGERADRTTSTATPTPIVAGATITPAATATVGVTETVKKVGLHSKQKPHQAVITKGKAPVPPAGAKKTNNIGRGKLAVKTDNSAGDTDSFWVEELDINGDGQVEQTDILYDDEDKMLYLFAETDFACADGQNEGRGAMLMAVNGQGNRRNRPVGSGWYIVELDAGECAAQTAALWGCRFDANGNRTECGLAQVEVVQDDIIIVEADRSATTSASGTPTASPRATATAKP